MTPMSRLLKCSAAATLALCVTDAFAGEATYPARPIRLIVPLAAGGPADTVSRLIGKKLTESLGQSVVVDNRAGASTLIGTELASRAPPDGYTLLTVTTTHTINPSVFRSLPYDPVKSFTPVTLVEGAPFMLVIHPSVQAATVKELIALARAQPGKINYASAGNGSSQHLTAELFRTAAKVEMVHVPYKGAGPGFIDLVAGQVQMTFSSTVTSIPYVTNRQLRGLAVTSLRRSAAAPSMPTVAESGFPGFESSSWVGMLAPAGTPEAIVNRLQQEVASALKARDVNETLAGMGADPGGLTPKEFGAYFQSEMKKWGTVIREAGLKLD